MARSTTQTVRIIGGRWRGRRVPFLATDGLRPTPDRVRETLFNWLQQRLPGSRCLDLFAGSGGLGIEALSRGASQVVFVERNRAQVAMLKDCLHTLGAGSCGHVVCDEAHRWLSRTQNPFDVVFVDPPFDGNLHEPVFAAIANNGIIREGSAVYVESHRSGDYSVPINWQLEKDKSAGVVSYRLYRVAAEGVSI